MDHGSRFLGAVDEEVEEVGEESVEGYSSGDSEATRSTSE